MNIPLLSDAHFYFTTTANQLRDLTIRQSEAFFIQGDNDRDAIQSPADLLARQAAVKEQLLQSLGGCPESETPLNACVTGVIPGDDYRIEKIIFQSRPKHFVTANLYIPNALSGPAPAILFLCGHSAIGKAALKYQTVCQLLARAGFIVLAQDPIGQGERLSYYDKNLKQPRVGPCVSDHDYAGIISRMVGDNLGRYILHDAMRSLDYLESRPEVDATRLGVTGNSGGGTQTSLLMGIDPRVKAAAPGTFIMNRESYIHSGQPQDSEQVWHGFTAAGFDHEDLLLAMAPKPVAVLAATSDFFPIEGTRRSVDRVRRFWEMHGSAENLCLFEDHVIHGYSLPLARYSTRFFSTHFLGKTWDETEAISHWEGSPLSEQELYCTQSGQVSVDFPDAEFAFHSNLTRIQEATDARLALPQAERKSRAIEWLGEQIFGPRKGLPGTINPRLISQREPYEAFDVDHVFWYPQRYSTNTAYLFRAAGETGKNLGVTIAVWAEGSKAIHPHFEWIAAETQKGRAVLLLNLSAMGPLIPHENVIPSGVHGLLQAIYKLDDELYWNGDSLAALRTWEVTRAIDMLHAITPHWADLNLSDIHLYGHGNEGLYAHLAAAIDPRVRSRQWENAFTWRSIAHSRYYNTHNIKARILPGALRYFDLDEI